MCLSVFGVGGTWLGWMCFPVSIERGTDGRSKTGDGDGILECGLRREAGVVMDGGRERERREREKDRESEREE